LQAWADAAASAHALLKSIIHARQRVAAGIAQHAAMGAVSQYIVETRGIHQAGSIKVPDQLTCATEGHLYGPLGKCVMCGQPAPPPGIPLVSGVGRDAECKTALVLYCTREPTDDEMRAIHDAVRGISRGH
jgi:hypothetical protein